MPRALRSDFAGEIYHALNRGNADCFQVSGLLSCLVLFVPTLLERFTML